MNRFSYLNLFHGISQDEYHLLTANMATKSFKKGEFVVKAGAIQRNLYFVNAGVQMAYVEQGEKTHVVSFSYSPQLCSITESFAFQKPTRQAIICLSNSELDYVTYEQLQSIFNTSPNIERLFRRIMETFLVGVVNRNIELHATTMEERFQAFCKRSAPLLHLVPHKYIASFLDIDPTNFSKLFNNVKI